MNSLIQAFQNYSKGELKTHVAVRSAGDADVDQSDDVPASEVPAVVKDPASGDAKECTKDVQVAASEVPAVVEDLPSADEKECAHDVEVAAPEVPAVVAHLPSADEKECSTPANKVRFAVVSVDLHSICICNPVILLQSYKHKSQRSQQHAAGNKRSTVCNAAIASYEMIFGKCTNESGSDKQASKKSKRRL